MNQLIKAAKAALEACPCCGGEALVAKGYATESVWRHGDFYRVFCGSCQLRQLFYKTKNEAISAWNLRAAIQQAVNPVAAEYQYFDHLKGEWRKCNLSLDFYRTNNAEVRALGEITNPIEVPEDLAARLQLARTTFEAGTTGYETIEECIRIIAQLLEGK